MGARHEQAKERALAKLPAREVPRVDARQPWEPLLCAGGGGASCNAAAVVVLDDLAAELADARPSSRRKHGCKTGDALVRELAGLCARHFSAWRPGVALATLGWGERLEIAAAERLHVELHQAAVEVAGSEVEKGGEHDGAWSGARRVGRRRAADATPAAAVASGRVYVERRGFVEELNTSGMLHGADPARCTRLRSCQRRKDRRLVREAFDSWPAKKRCSCAVW